MSWVTDIPSITWTYWSTVDPMIRKPGLYHMDSLRKAYHEELCEAYSLTRDQTLPVTDNMHRYETAADMHIDLVNIQKVNL